MKIDVKQGLMLGRVYDKLKEEFEDVEFDIEQVMEAWQLYWKIIKKYMYGDHKDGSIFTMKIDNLGVFSGNLKKLRTYYKNPKMERQCIKNAFLRVKKEKAQRKRK